MGANDVRAFSLLLNDSVTLLDMKLSGKQHIIKKIISVRKF
jgi:hypothetical protein